MLKCVIFDLDGVLVSTDEYHYLAWKKIADELGVPFDHNDNMRQRGVSRMESLEVVLQKCDRNFSESEKLELATSKNDRYKMFLEQNLDSSCILDGVIDTLEYLKTNGITIAVGSSSKNAPFILEKTNLGKYMKVVVSGLDITNSKPHPEVFLKAGNLSCCEPKECLVVEDAQAGVQSGKAAGMQVLAVGAAYDNTQADFRYHSLSDKTFSWDNIIKGFN
ncbi:MAG: beta-phosphoglucomutase [Oscillospiraceae bacterium]